MQFSAGSVFSRTIETTFKNFIPFLVLGLLVQGPVIAINLLVDPVYREVQVSSLNPYAEGDLARVTATGTSRTTMFLLQVLDWVASGVLSAALAYAVFKSLQGSRVGIGDALAKGLRSIVPVAIASLVIAILVGIGFVLLIVPGVILACMYFVALPAIAVERVSALESLKRSAELTRGHRVSIFVLFLIFMLVGVGAYMLLFAVLSGLGLILGGLIALAAGAFIGLMMGVAQAVTYHDLRVMKEGVDTGALVAVFE